MVLQRDTSTLGTVIGIIVAVVAIGGSVFLDWEWGAFPNQPVPLVIGVIAAAAAVLVTYRQIRG
ncbi:multidrug transporter [Halobacterium sp. KA-4]|uniref:multidrug transporter n=1 Tax=Halobacterium sp. KA-4 TaxID=2896367 RepID=UPI001E61FB87|nr:multidrug transporter [Halobacterium sp. KA-4]MCD2200993.1 multidrug transporter [Halobacterium sp. KA-4]